MIGSDGAEEEKKKSRGQYSGAGGAQPNVKESLLFCFPCGERHWLLFGGGGWVFEKRSSYSQTTIRGRIRFIQQLQDKNVSMPAKMLCMLNQMLSDCQSQPNPINFATCWKEFPHTLDCRRQITSGVNMLIWRPDPAWLPSQALE